MKKMNSKTLTKLFFAALLLIPFAGFSQLNENFDVSSLPAGWTQIDKDGDGFWFRLYTVGTDAHSGTSVAGSRSFSATALTPDNWLITPQLSVNSTSDSITYWVKTMDPAYPAEHYAVLVSTTGINTSDFTTTLYESTLTSADGIWNRKAFSLSAFTGQQVYVAFRHYNCTDNFMLVIDDVTGPALAIATGLEEQSSVFTIFPNPAHNSLQINAKTNIDEIKVLNIIGEVIFDSNVDVKTFTLNTSSFNQGTYLLHVRTGNSISIKRFIVQ